LILIEDDDATNFITLTAYDTDLQGITLSSSPPHLKQWSGLQLVSCTLMKQGLDVVFFDRWQTMDSLPFSARAVAGANVKGLVRELQDGVDSTALLKAK
jgi:hypothetical protein